MTIAKRLKETAAGLSLSLALASGEGQAEVDTEAVPSAIGVPETRRSGGRAPSYVDGTYVARGWYGGLSSITVSLTVSDNLVTEVEVQPHATDPTSLDLQRRFAAAVPQVVVGRRLDQVRLGQMAWSNGAPKGFTDALTKIKDDASSLRPRIR